MACGGEPEPFAPTSSSAATAGTGGGGVGGATNTTTAAVGGGTGAVGGSTGNGPTTTTGGGGDPSGGCSSAGPGSGDHAGTLTFDGESRDYVVHVPAGHDNGTPVPVVFDLHGLGSNASQQQFISGWQAVSDANGFVVVRVEGWGSFQSWNGGDTCCGQALSSGLDDVGLMKEILARVSQDLCVDASRVYASGLSNGGAMSHRLACDAADVFAAVAPVAYPIAYLPISKCQPSQPIGVFHSHGTGDTTVPYDGGFGIASANASFAQWGSINGCSDSPSETYSQGNSYCDSYTQCSGGVEVTLCTVDGPHLLYNNADDVPIAELAWAFFQKHTRL